MTIKSAPSLKELTTDSTSAEGLVWPIPVLKENHHYYMENGFMVFTEKYHQARGSCCGNSCRHCPFDYINVVGK